jgi:preprotein translocase subunit YajC
MTHALSAALLILQSPTNALLGPIFMYGAIFAVFYFVLLRPQGKQRKMLDAEIRSVKKGDEVITTGGIIGEVLHIKDTVTDAKANPLEDRITIRSGESKLIIERGRIARVIRANATVSTPNS